jgi:Transposase IS116/IS110/IS902 family
LARGRLRDKRADLERALAGAVGPHQRFLLGEQLRHLAALDEAIARVSAEIAARVRPVAGALEALDTIPGVARRTAEALVAEVGTDLTRFPAAAHLASWAGLCPGNHQSAGKRLSGRARKANPWLRAALTEAAQGAARTKQTYLGAQYRRLAARRGAKRAAIAVGHRILVIAYHLLTTGEVYADLGPNSIEPSGLRAARRAGACRARRAAGRPARMTRHWRGTPASTTATAMSGRSRFLIPRRWRPVPGIASSPGIGESPGSGDSRSPERRLASLASGPFSPVRGRGDVRQLTPSWANMVLIMT